MAKKATKRKPPAASKDETRELRALEARIAQLKGEKLGRQQIRDVEWLRTNERKVVIEQWCKAVPKGDYCRLSGRQHKLVDDAARNYNLPLDSATIDLAAALKALHDLIAAHAHRLRHDLNGDRDELEEEKLRQQIVGLERDNERKLIELQFTRGDAIPKVAVRDSLISLAARLRTLGQTLARIDPEARKALNDFLEALLVEIDGGEFSF